MGPTDEEEEETTWTEVIVQIVARFQPDAAVLLKPSLF
jgi:hypothetical protein